LTNRCRQEIGRQKTKPPNTAHLARGEDAVLPPCVRWKERLSPKLSQAVGDLRRLCRDVLPV
jgi:hypothetical protein